MSSLEVFYLLNRVKKIIFEQNIIHVLNQAVGRLAGQSAISRRALNIYTTEIRAFLVKWIP